MRARADGAERYHVALHACPRRVAPVLAPSTGVSYMCACMWNNGVKRGAAGWEGARGVGREAHQQRSRRAYSTCPRDAGSTRPRSRRPEPPSGGSLAELWPSRSDHSLWPDELRKEAKGPLLSPQRVGVFTRQFRNTADLRTTPKSRLALAHTVRGGARVAATPPLLHSPTAAERHFCKGSTVHFVFLLQ